MRAAIGYVSQGSSTDPLLTAVENLEIAARLRGMGAADARSRARRLLDEFGLAEASRRPVSTFSGGMRRRLDVAAALVHRPQVLFLDEPTTGLDPEARATMWAEIRRLSGEEALTVVLTTHYLEEADRLAHEILLVDEGRAVVQGTPAELKAALHGDSLRVSLIEPDPDAVRRAVAGRRRISATSWWRHPGSRACSPPAPTTPPRRSALSSPRWMPRASASVRSRHPTPPSTMCTCTSSGTPSATAALGAGRPTQTGAAA